MTVTSKRMETKKGATFAAPSPVHHPAPADHTSGIGFGSSPE